MRLMAPAGGGDVGGTHDGLRAQPFGATAGSGQSVALQKATMLKKLKIAKKKGKRKRRRGSRYSDDEAGSSDSEASDEDGADESDVEVELLMELCQVD